jgi:hypothetical protein
MNAEREKVDMLATAALTQTCRTPEICWNNPNHLDKILLTWQITHIQRIHWQKSLDFLSATWAPPPTATEQSGFALSTTKSRTAPKTKPKTLLVYAAFSTPAKSSSPAQFVSGKRG